MWFSSLLIDRPLEFSMPPSSGPSHREKVSRYLEALSLKPKGGLALRIHLFVILIDVIALDAQKTLARYEIRSRSSLRIQCLLGRTQMPNSALYSAGVCR